MSVRERERGDKAVRVFFIFIEIERIGFWSSEKWLILGHCCPTHNNAKILRFSVSWFPIFQFLKRFDFATEIFYNVKNAIVFDRISDMHVNHGVFR